MCFRVINTLRKENAQPQRQKGEHHEAHIRAGLHEGSGNEAGIEKARREHQAMEKEILETEDDDFGFAYRLYRQMKDCGNEYIDLSIAIHDEVKVLNTLRKYGIERFTFSSGWSSAVESAWIFQQNGCKLEGLIELNGLNKDWFGTGEREKVHGYLFSLQ